MKRLTLGNGKTCLQPEDEATFALDHPEGDLVEIIERQNTPWRTIREMLEDDDV